MVVRLRDVGTTLSRVHPLLYLLIYFAAIPAFAAGYFCISSELYSPYARFEPAAAEDRQKLASLIEAAVQRQLRSRKPDSEIVVDGWHADNGSLQVLSADSADGSAIDFKLVIKLSIETPRGTTVTFPQIPVSFPSAKGEVVRTPGYNRSYPNNVRPTTFKAERLISKQQALAQALYTEVFRSYGESVLVDEALALSERESKQIDNLFQAFGVIRQRSPEHAVECFISV